MSTTISCPHCQQAIKFGMKQAGKKVFCPHCQVPVRLPAMGQPASAESKRPQPQTTATAPTPAPAAKPARPRVETPRHNLLPVKPTHTLEPFSPLLALVLSILTLNIFGMLRLMVLHGAFPRRRPDDPTAARAVVNTLIPLFNIYWAPFALGRLVTRLNEQRKEWGLPELRLTWLVVVVTLCTWSPLAGMLLIKVNDELAPVLTVGGPLLNLLLFVPLLLTIVQSGANAVAEASYANEEENPAACLVQAELRCRAQQRVAWGCYLLLLAAVHGTIVFLGTRNDTSVSKNEAVIGNLVFVSLPLLSGASSLFTRAFIMVRRRTRLDETSTQVEDVVTAEIRTTRQFQLGWGIAFTLASVAALTSITMSIIELRPSRALLVQDLLPPVLFAVLPLGLIATYLFARSGQRPAEGDGLPSLRLATRRLPWWPALTAGGLALLLVGSAQLFKKSTRAEAYDAHPAVAPDIGAVKPAPKPPKSTPDIP